MILAFALEPDCSLLLAEATLSGDGSGWREDARLEVQATPRCSQLTIPLPAGVTLVAAQAREKRIDGRSGRVGAHQWSFSSRSVDGTAVATLHTPELSAGDRLILEVTRTAPAGGLRWAPGASAAYAAITVDGELDFATNTEPGFGFDLPGEAAAPRAPLAPAGDVKIERHLRLSVPDGDPQVVLYPGGGSSAEVIDYLVFPPANEARGWPLDTPSGADVELVAEPEGLASLRPDGVVQIEPTTVPVKLRVSWTIDDAPTFGERDAAWTALEVFVDDGVIRWEGDQWFLHRVHGVVVLPDRAALERALDARFRALSMPEPGSPMALRGAAADWTTAAAIPGALADRVAIAEHTALDPLFPRRLTRAVRSGAVTPVEAALVTWLWARQQRFDADWYLVRPASRGASGPTVPSGYDRALVRIALDGEVRWIDPSCRVCAPFELPPDLEGASVLGPRAAEGPAPTLGTERVEVGDHEVRWHLEGPAALDLRAWLREIPAAARPAQLAHRLGGSGAELRSLVGADVAGAPIDVVVSRGEGALYDPLATAPSADQVWWPWLGTRELRRVGASGVPATFQGAGMTYTAAHDGDAWVERLVVGARGVDVTVARALDAARVSPRAPAPATP